MYSYSSHQLNQATIQETSDPKIPTGTKQLFPKPENRKIFTRVSSKTELFGKSESFRFRLRNQGDISYFITSGSNCISAKFAHTSEIRQLTYTSSHFSVLTKAEFFLVNFRVSQQIQSQKVIIMVILNVFSKCFSN